MILGDHKQFLTPLEFLMLVDRAEVTFSWKYSYFEGSDGIRFFLISNFIKYGLYLDDLCNDSFSFSPEL